MNKKELIKAVSEESKLSLQQTELVVDAFLDTIKKNMVQKNDIAIAGFGNFTAKIRKARKGRNPSTGTEMLIPEKVVPVFKPGIQLRELVNKKEN